MKDIKASESQGLLPEHIVAGEGVVYFSAYDDIHGEELWRSDGTPAGTELVVDVEPGRASSYPEKLTYVNGAVYFATYYGLWRSDGTSCGTRLVRETRPDELFTVGDTLFFTDVEGLWKTDGTPGGTERIRDAWGTQLANMGGTLFYAGWVPGLGLELVKSDGTAAGTVVVKDIYPGTSSSQPWGLTAVGNVLYFYADDGLHGAELWAKRRHS